MAALHIPTAQTTIFLFNFSTKDSTKEGENF